MPPTCRPDRLAAIAAAEDSHPGPSLVHRAWFAGGGPPVGSSLVLVARGR